VKTKEEKMDNKKQDIEEAIDLLKSKLGSIQENTPEVEDDYHRLFLYFVGYQFEGQEPDELKICDGKDDMGIDIYIAEDDRFAIYQCKLPEWETMEEEYKIESFGPDLINDAEDALSFITNEKGDTKGNKEAKEARNLYRNKKRISAEAESDYKLEVYICCFGKLTPAAQDRLDELKNEWAKKDGNVEIKTIDFDDIANILSESSLMRERPKSLRLYYHEEGEVHTRTWGYTLVPAKQFCQFFDDYKMSLFDLNVRYYLEKSHINKEIIKTLNEIKGQKHFHLLNNGITISCSGCDYKEPNKGSKTENRKYIILHNPQIINGCQTVISIHRAYHQFTEEQKQQNFEMNCLVPVRMIITSDIDLLSKIVTASNNQNIMSPRNLRSNSRHQKVLQNRFRELSYKWFYERKDGEFDSFKINPPRWFKKIHFQSKQGTERIVSNEDIAKTWLSFIGFSRDASERINAFGFESNKYEFLFEKTPKDTHWNLISYGAQAEFDEEKFDNGSPSPEQYLLSYIIYRFIKASLPTPQQNKKEAIAKLKSSGLLKENPSTEEEKSALMTNENFVINQILYNMKEVIVELYSWIFINAYGPINKETSTKILNFKAIKEIYENPDFIGYAKNHRETTNPENMLTNCFGFIKDAVGRWYSRNEQDYQSNPRRTRFLHSKDTITKLKNSLISTNENTKAYEMTWKKPGIEFLKSLPKL
jgi:hypothetical protein